ncbi:hypothetical protein Q1695_004083 [Nippostrongylus brasiliensis]|nr:hypothetical protein Q1695_004083 [Nippostrongylus brasiliensis]
MAETCSQDLVTPFLSKILGPMEVLRTNLKCDKQTDGNYLYEYTVQVHPKEEDEGLAALLRSESGTSVGGATTSDYSTSRNYSAFSSAKQSTHSEVDCICMVDVRFVLIHHNMNGKAQLRLRDEFACVACVREVIDHFRIESDGVHRGVFAPRLSYVIGKDLETSYPLQDHDLEKSIAELFGSEIDANTLTIIADVT